MPEGLKLDFEVRNSGVEFTVPRINGHEMVTVEFI